MPTDELKDWQPEMSGWRDLFDSCILAVTRKANLQHWQPVTRTTDLQVGKHETNVSRSSWQECGEVLGQ